MMPIKLTVVFGDPPDLHDREFYIETGEDRGYFLKWFWRAVAKGQRFGIFTEVLKENDK